MTDELRQRTVPATNPYGDKQPQTTTKRASSPSKLHKDSNGWGVLDVLRILLGALALSSALSWFITGESLIWGYKPWFTQLGAVKSWINGPVLLTDAELATFDGTDPTKPIYVGLNGTIYDVSASSHTYGPGGSYSFFSGKDAARAFITGCFKEDLTPDLRGVEQMYIPQAAESDAQLSKGEVKIRRERDLRIAKKKVKEGIEGWAKVFRGDTGRPYFQVGTVQREEGWLEKLPKRLLCDAAEQARPKRDQPN